jgi:N-acetyl-anhydromuramoyl-L-alanine amidase
VHSVISVDGWLASAVPCPSPNLNSRPPGQDINLLVIHNISLPPGDFGTGCVQAFFCNQLDVSQDPYFETLSDLKVSAHLFIDRLGIVTQFVAFTERAWHAGASSFEGIANCNDYSIGIELEGCDDIEYTSAQYDALASVTLQLLKVYPSITRDRIVGHSEIAPGRKTDPGKAFDWTRYHFLLNSELSL